MATEKAFLNLLSQRPRTVNVKRVKFCNRHLLCLIQVSRSRCLTLRIILLLHEWHKVGRVRKVVLLRLRWHLRSRCAKETTSSNNIFLWNKLEIPSMSNTKLCYQSSILNNKSKNNSKSMLQEMEIRPMKLWTTKVAFCRIHLILQTNPSNNWKLVIKIIIKTSVVLLVNFRRKLIVLRRILD